MRQPDQYLEHTDLITSHHSSRTITGYLSIGDPYTRLLHYVILQYLALVLNTCLTYSCLHPFQILALLSRLDYCNSLLVGLPRYLIKSLQGVQNATARSILRTPRSEHISPLLKNLHWLAVNRRTLHKVAALCYSSLSGSGPQYLSDLTHVYTPARSLRSSSDTRILNITNVKLKSYGQRSFAYHGPTTWKSLPLALKYQQESDCFKRALKTHLSINE